MRAVRVNAFGLDQVVVAEEDRPAPAADEVLIRVLACSLNYRDVLVARGEYNPHYPLPLILGSDCCGEIVELGADAHASGLRVGDRVCPIFSRGWLTGSPTRNAVRNSLGGPLPGVFAELAVARADSVVVVPSTLDPLEAACLPCAGVTAWSALATLGNVQAGDVVLTIGSGGVSLFGIQLAGLLGARVIATTRTPEKRARLLALGAHEALVTAGPGYGETVRRLAGGEGVDHVLEVGGVGTLPESLAAVRPGGTVSLIGVLAGGRGPVDLRPAVMRNVRLQGVFVGSRSSFEALLAAWLSRGLRPVIDTVYPLSRARDAFEHLASGRHFGKICLVPDEGSRG
ncbi:MAG TPA: NAD(P)-dependent alcohol dehydrogenase [Polyangiaceae bacterium]|nr:NAD(P)-dependent alcohol dehydrogenase [Polyangiaceae bacterium]